MNKKVLISKPIVSITEMARQVQLSRARFYQLLTSGFFPQPIYEIRSRRPFFDIVLQQKCVECRQSGIGINGSYLLFYSLRQNKPESSKVSNPKIDPLIQEITDTLQSMGLNVSAKQVQEGMVQVFPEGSHHTQDQGVLVRELFRYFKQTKKIG